jgi:hypothetical protein
VKSSQPQECSARDIFPEAGPQAAGPGEAKRTPRPQARSLDGPPAGTASGRHLRKKPARLASTQHNNARRKKHMRPQNNRGRGGRRRGGHSRRPSESYTPRPAPKKTLWQKIISFFTGGDAKPQQQRTTTVRTESTRATTTRTVTPRPARKPEMVDVTSPKLYVGNLSFDATESDLFELFKGVGSVQNAEIVSHKQTMKSKGFAFVTMMSVDEARRAVEVLHDQDFMGRKLVVSGAKTSDVRHTSSSSYGESDEQAA